MVRAKNYETTSTFIKVMQKKLWPLFFRTRCIYRLYLFIYLYHARVE